MTKQTKSFKNGNYIYAPSERLFVFLSRYLFTTDVYFLFAWFRAYHAHGSFCFIFNMALPYIFYAPDNFPCTFVCFSNIHTSINLQWLCVRREINKHIANWWMNRRTSIFVQSIRVNYVKRMSTRESERKRERETVEKKRNE